MRVTRTATQIDVVTRDTELFFALTALAAGATGRVNVFHGLAQWAEHVEADMRRCVF